jgi:hypothetical protein
MTDSLERFLQDLRFDLPAGMVERAKAAALDAAGAGQPRRVRLLDRGAVDSQKQSWAPALVAALLVVAIVATLLLVVRSRGSVPVGPGPVVPSPYSTPSPYSITPPPPVTQGCSSVPRQWASSPPNPAKMLSATTGWAYGPMRTTDGGAHWLDVSPPSIPGRTVKNDEFFLDATHAWVAETASSSNSCVDRVVTFRTADGGRTWQQAAPIPVRFAVPTDVIWTGHANHAGWFDFVDPENGWLLLGSGPATPIAVDLSWNGADWRVGDLYRTTDGGQHWTLVATNPGSATGCIPAPLNELHASVMSVSSPATGWMVSTCGLLVTRDGGLTWGKSVTPLSPKEAPLFFNPSHGLIFADGGILVTSDGGASWSIRRMPAGVRPLDFMNPSEGWALGNGDNAVQCSLEDLRACNHNFRLYHTSDSGKTWVPGSFTSLAMPAPKFWPPAYIHFVDSNNGYASTGEGPPESGLFRTTDAGRTWTRVDGLVQGP